MIYFVSYMFCFAPYSATTVLDRRGLRTLYNKMSSWYNDRCVAHHRQLGHHSQSSHSYQTHMPRRDEPGLPRARHAPHHKSRTLPQPNGVWSCTYLLGGTRYQVLCSSFTYCLVWRTDLCTQKVAHLTSISSIAPWHGANTLILLIPLFLDRHKLAVVSVRPDLCIESLTFSCPFFFLPLPFPSRGTDTPRPFTAPLRLFEKRKLPDFAGRRNRS